MVPAPTPKYHSMLDHLVSSIKHKVTGGGTHHHDDSGHQNQSVARAKKVNAVYYPSWKVYKGEKPSDLNVEKVTHVFYAFMRIQEDGTIVYLDEFGDLNKEVDGVKGCLAALQQLKQRNPHIKTIFSIGGGSGSKPFPALASRPESRERFAKCARELVDKHGADGIDIDWEHPHDAQQGHDFISLLTSIRIHLPPPYLLTTALPAGPWCLQHIDLTRASSLLDFLNLMTYDFAGPWTPESGHQSQLYTPKNPHCPGASRSCKSGVDYLLGRRFPAEKILLGIPVYGRAFSGCRWIGEKHACAGKEICYDYRELPLPGCKEGVDSEAMAAYSHDREGAFVSYDNPQTVAAKASFAVSQRLGGLFYWTGSADARGERSLVETGWKALNAAFP